MVNLCGKVGGVILIRPHSVASQVFPCLRAALQHHLTALLRQTLLYMQSLNKRVLTPELLQAGFASLQQHRKGGQ